MEEKIEGRIFKTESKDYYVLTGDDKTFRCSLRGKFKKELELKKDKLLTKDFAVVGDYVEFETVDEDKGVIFNVRERKSIISRKAPKIKGGSRRGERFQQIIAANVDQLFVISSASQPSFNNRIIDRLIVEGESSKVKTNIVINKIDLDNKNEIQAWIDLYRKIGYDVFPTNGLTGEGISELKNELFGKTSVFWGQSGVGKSTLLNQILPALNLKTNEISDWSSKGKHTTVTSLMIKLDDSTFVVDTPGIREIEPFGIRKEDLGHYFVEFENYLYDCKFNTCTHQHEPGCAVTENIGKDISAERYQSYLNMLETIEDDIFFE